MAQAIRQGKSQTKTNNIQELQQPKLEEMEQELENMRQTEAKEEAVKGGQEETADIPAIPDKVRQTQPVQTKENWKRYLISNRMHVGWQEEIIFWYKQKEIKVNNECHVWCNEET